MNKKIIIDPGHGGMDSGAVGNNLQEKDLTLQVSKYIYNRLKELNIPVSLTRDTDEYLPKDKRIKRINEIGIDKDTILISNHINAGGGEGAEVVYALRSDDELANMILNNIGNKGQIKRKIYQRRLPENPNKDYYYIIRETGDLEPILIEYGFIDNKNDSLKLKNNLNDYGEAVVQALLQYLGYENEIGQNEKYYIVQKGETLYSISKKTGVSIENLKEINNLDSNILSINQKLLLEKNINNDNQYEEYIVKKGDSLWSISQKYNITVKELVELNDLKSLVLQINQKLRVPKKEEIYEEYIVKKGDTLWSIAKNYNIDIDEIKKLNNLTSNLLSIYQILKIKKN